MRFALLATLEPADDQQPIIEAVGRPVISSLANGAVSAIAALRVPFHPGLRWDR
jgi:hypothetical protein